MLFFKPRSSRAASVEQFAVCRGFRLPPGLAPERLRALLGGAEAPGAGAEAAGDKEGSGGGGGQGGGGGGAGAVRELIPFLERGDLSGFD